MKRLEASRADTWQVPLLFIDVDLDGHSYAGGRETTEQEWWAEYGDEVERERRRNPDRIFIMDFGFHGDSLQAGRTE